MTQEQYNGWTNYETWCVNLWMGNDQASHLHYDLLARECLSESQDDKMNTRAENATRLLAERLKQDFEDGNPLSDDDRPADVYTDLLSSALSEVNWHEIASGLIENVQS